MSPAEPGGNRTTPGRDTPDLTEEEIAEANTMADELLKGSIDTDLEKNYLVNSLIAYLTVKKNLELKDCNGFTVPCPNACSTRRLNEMKFTFCLAHSLLNEQGIPSACEYDVDAVLTMMMLINISGKAPHMGNTSILPYKDGNLHMLWRLEEADIAEIDDRSNLVYSEHAVPNRKFHGISEKASEYGLKHFALDQGFGAVLRHDFKKDAGQTITLARFSPDATKLFIANGTIVGGGGFSDNNCNNYVIFRVNDQNDFFKKQSLFGNHVPL